MADDNPPAGSRRIPLGAWAGLAAGAVLMLVAVVFAVVIAAGGTAQATRAKDASGCATWPLCGSSASPSPSSSPSYAQQQPMLIGDLPVTAQMPYDGVLRAGLSPRWKLMPDSQGDHQHYQSTDIVCDLTIDHVSSAPQAGSDRDQTEALLDSRFAHYQGDKRITDVGRRRLATQWVPVVGSTARLEFESDQVDYRVVGDQADATFSDIGMVRVIASKGETVYAELQCPTESPGNMPTAMLTQAFDALQFQER